MHTRRDIFQALADPTRRAIMCLLASQAMTPGALASHFQCSRQAISKHLQVLTDCGVLKQQPEGREIHYQLEAASIRPLEDWLSQFRQLLDQRFNQLDDILRQLQNPPT